MLIDLNQEELKKIKNIIVNKKIVEESRIVERGICFNPDLGIYLPEDLNYMRIASIPSQQVRGSNLF